VPFCRCERKLDGYVQDQARAIVPSFSSQTGYWVQISGFNNKLILFDLEVTTMKIKSLLLGSAAALIAVSGAQAADAVIVEPEPVEYVRICDAYGAGFFYIPGTETCLKFSGYVRVNYKSNHYHDADSAPLPTHRHRVTYRGRFNIDARNETEWGTLRSQLRLQGGPSGAPTSADDVFSQLAGGSPRPGFRGSGDANVGIDRALISLAGFRLGYSDDYWTTIGGYGLPHDSINDGFYGFGQATFFDYTYAADGFTLTAGVQVAAAGNADGFAVNSAGAIAPVAASLGGSSGLAGQPDLYVGADYSGSWGRIYGTYYYDSSVANGAYKVGMDLSLADYIPGGSIGVTYQADDGETDYVHGHLLGFRAQMDLSDSWQLYAGYYDYDFISSDTYNNTGDDLTQWTVGTRWKMAPGLTTNFEYTKTTSNTPGYYGIGQFNVRVVRSF